MATELADFGAGCFWGVEATFRALPGVLDVKVGYEGGTVDQPTYRQVCTGRTGHVEVVQVSYDPAVVNYATLLETFFENHDPTTLNRQGPDFGEQYRSVIFYHTPQQQAAALAEKKRRDMDGQYVGPIVTAVEHAATFYPAEDYHQQYFAKRGMAAHCHAGNGKR